MPSGDQRGTCACIGGYVNCVRELPSGLLRHSVTRQNAEAIKIVLSAKGSPDGTVEEQIAKYIETLNQENKIESLSGWESKQQEENTCIVTYTYKEKGAITPEVLEWEVKLNERKVHPENASAQKFTK